VPKFLLDSDVIIEWLRHNDVVTDWIAAHDAAGSYLACSVVSVAEIYAGLRVNEEHIIGDILTILACVEVDENTARKAGHYRRQFGRSHGVELADALIAASAHRSGLTLCSFNLKHYPMSDVKKFTIGAGPAAVKRPRPRP